MTVPAAFKFLLLAGLLAGVFARGINVETAQEPETFEAETAQNPGSETIESRRKLAEAKLFHEQAENAVYNYTTNLVDSIMDVTQGKIEVRKGVHVEGKYWYSNGVEKRTVVYVADDKGYRVVSDTVELLAPEPKFDANGHISVHTNIAGQDFSYSVTADDIAHYKEDAAKRARV
ncbi:uncharacterized protein LOC124411939 [Diprion similis]|uniref:uncharacterized protein LOC124411939 n=1 Tax=Diprion similis TaxID=362088 RepID=UPI001EF947FB|nr:uncharacterized protein LOC124411939 [Diprion similis]